MSKVKSVTAIAEEAKTAVPASEKNVETAATKTSADKTVEKKEAAPAKKEAAPKKETAPKKEAAKKAESTEKKVTEKKPVEKKPAAPAKKAAAPKKPAAPAKKPAVKKDPVSSIFIEFEGKQIVAEDVLNAAKKSYESMNKNSDIKTIEIYVKPEENAAYYVVNGQGSDEFKVIL